MKKFFNLTIFLFFLSIVLTTNAPRQVLARECPGDQFCVWTCEQICAMFPWREICPCLKPTPPPSEPTPTTPLAHPTPTEVPGEPMPTDAPGKPTPTEIPGEPTPTEVLKPTPTVVKEGEDNGGAVSGPGAPGPAGPPHCGAAVPLAPTLLRVSFVATDQQELGWTAVELATHYSVHYGRSSGNYEYGVPDVGKTTSFTVGGLAAGINYCFAVRAVNDCAPSELSNEICMGQLAGQVLGVRTTVLGATSSKKPIEWVVEIFGYLSLLSGACLIVSPRLKLSFLKH